MRNLTLQLLNGLTFGGLLFMVASGFTLVFGLMRIVNLAHGAFFLLGAYVGISVQRMTGNWYLAIVAGAVLVGVLSLIVQLGLMRRVQGDDKLETLLTLGIGFIIADAILAIWGGMPQSIRAVPEIARPVALGNIVYPGTRLFVLGVAVTQGVVLWLLLARTQLGRMIRAGVDHRVMVSALGININLVFTSVFLLAGVLVGLSGVIGGSVLAFQPGTDMFILTYAIVVVIMGGMGSLGGAALGAVAVGLTDSFTKAYFPQLSMLVIFVLLSVVLAFRPQGFFGRER
jgi:branched-chain amino acid transport system permease protein